VVRLHALMTRRSQPDIAGHYARHSRQILGSPCVFPTPEAVPQLMETFGRHLSLTAGAAGAFEAHYNLVTIHPFDAGNGRTARLLMNMILIRDGYTPLVITPEHRDDYLQVIRERQLAEPIGCVTIDQASRDAYSMFMAKRLIESLQDHIAHFDPGSP